MEQQHQNGSNPGGGREDSKESRKRSRSGNRPKHGHWKAWILVGVLLLASILGSRAYLPYALRDYVNRTLDRNLLYEGRIGRIEVHLLRGAYSIRDVHISKRTGDVPVPLFAAKVVDFSVQWSALVHGRVVGRLLIQQPELNFVAGQTEDQSQSGSGGPWLKTIQDLFPFDINSAVIQDGSVHFLTFQSAKPVDVYLSHLNASIDDLTNIRDQTNPMIATVQASALVMNQAKLQYKMTLDPFSYHPTFHLALRLLGLDVTKLNDLALTYGKFDFKRGWFDLVVETDSKEGQITGYLKPLFRDLKVFSLAADVKEDNVLQFFWQALLGATTTVFKNFSRNQFGTLIPFTADATATTSADILATIGNVLRNAFVRAYLPRLESGQSTVEDFHFEAPDFTESLSTTAEMK